MAAMAPLQLLRLVCAGVWHNAVLFVLAWAFLASGALQLTFRVVGWSHMVDGLSVVDVAPVGVMIRIYRSFSMFAFSLSLSLLKIRL